MAFRILITGSDGRAQEIDLNAFAMPVTLGRDSDQATIVIADPQMSRGHCRLSEARGGLLVEDLGSRNGSWINGSRIQKGLLTTKDVLKLGVTEVVIAEVDPPDPLEGTTLGNYHLQQVIGTGSYGTVYRALQLNLARPVAIKVLSAKYAEDPQRVQSFLTEAGRAGRLNHPNLVQVHDVFSIAGHYLLVMELMQASTMDHLEDRGVFDEAVLLQVMRDISRALAYADAQRIVHRDVKPDNILVNEEGTYKLADLGIAMPMNDEGQAIQERIFGSPPYVAPEQARGLPLDGRADLYALGATVWHLTTGRTLFSGTSKEMVHAHVNQPIPDLRRLAPQLSPAVVGLINNLLEKEPERRPPTAAELNRRIEQLLAEQLTQSGPVLGPVRPRQMRRIRNYRR